ncbi:MAG: hypothetical protein AB7S26_40995 [Sandaracinaceae bacterium]
MAMDSVLARVATAVLTAAFLGACELATIRPPGASDGGGMVDPETFFDAQVVPILTDECSGCHEGQRGASIQFLQPGSYYDSVGAFTTTGGLRLFIPGDPDNSEIVTKPAGSHTGGPYVGGSDSVVRQWIELEGISGPIPDAGPSASDPVQTEPRPVYDGQLIRIPLNTGTVELTGAYFTFNAQLNGTDLIMRDLAFEAGARGISLTEPRLYIWTDVSTMGVRDPNVARFDGSNFQVPAAGSLSVGTQQTIVDFPTGGRLSIEFTTADYM